MDAIGRNLTHVFASLGLKSSRTVAPSAALRQALSSTTIAWSIGNLRIKEGAICPDLGNASCVSYDSAGMYKSQEVGCYVGRGRKCAACDARKYWLQFGRLALCLQQMREHEVRRGRHYAWLARIRSDFKSVPAFPPYAAWRDAPSDRVYFNGLVGWSQDRHGDRRVFYDWFAVVPRELARRFFAVGFRFLRCQRREENEPLCAGGFDWATPECILKVHVSVCIGPSKLQTFPPWMAANGRPKASAARRLQQRRASASVRASRPYAELVAASSCVLVSSMPLRKLVEARAGRLVKSAVRLGLPLWVLYDADPDVASAALSALPANVRAEEIFGAIPRLHLLMRPGRSPIEEFAALRSSWEPLGGSAKNIHGLVYMKLLVRKVATIHHALSILVAERATTTGAHGGAPPQTVVWADEDVGFVRPWDAQLLQFARSVDVAYVPLQAPKGNPKFKPHYNFSHRGLAEPKWVVESGIMTFGVNARTHTLAAAAMEAYEGGLLRLARHCASVKRRSACKRGEDAMDSQKEQRACACPEWVTSMLYCNDIYVWALLVRMAAFRYHRAEAQLCCLRGGHGFFNLTQGWLPWHTSVHLQPSQLPFTAPFSLDSYALHKLRGPLSERAWLPGKEARQQRDSARLTPGLTYAALNRTVYARRSAKGYWEPAVSACGCHRLE